MKVMLNNLFIVNKITIDMLQDHHIHLVKTEIEHSQGNVQTG